MLPWFCQIISEQDNRGLRIIVITAESRIQVSARNQPIEWVRIPCQVCTTCVL